MSVYYTSLVAAILLGTAGQIALKSADEGSPTVIAQSLNSLTILGLAVYIVAALCYILAIKKIPVSIAFSSVAASYAVGGGGGASVVERAPGVAAAGGHRIDWQWRVADPSALRLGSGEKTANLGDNPIYRLVCNLRINWQAQNLGRGALGYAET
jgi:small multidrug resistance pump